MSILRLVEPPLATVHAFPRPEHDVSDARLIERARAGERAAAEAIYLRHVGYVMGLCLRLLGNREEAEDVVHDTFVDVLEQLHDLREPERLKQWVRGIAVHKVYRRFRRRRLLRALGFQGRPEGDEASLPAAPGATPEQAAELERLSRVLSALPDFQRAAWVLRHVDGQSLEEVALSGKCSLATAKRRIAAAEEVVLRHVAFRGEEVDDAP